MKLRMHNPISIIISYIMDDSTVVHMFVYLSHEKNRGWLGYIGDYTTQLYRDYDKPL